MFDWELRLKNTIKSKNFISRSSCQIAFII